MYAYSICIRLHCGTAGINVSALLFCATELSAKFDEDANTQRHLGYSSSSGSVTAWHIATQTRRRVTKLA